MKKKLLGLILLFGIATNSSGQDNWQLLNPTPTINACEDIHFITNEIGYIVTSSEILKTTDAGLTWSILQKIPSGKVINFQGSMGFIAGYFGCVLKSVDNGNTWASINTGTNESFNSVNIIDEDTIFLSSYSGTLRSSDGGNNWQYYSIPVEYGMPGYSVNKTVFTNSKVGHAACDAGKIIKTADGGLNWYVTKSLEASSSDFYTIYFTNSEIGFASCENNTIYKTTDGGESWIEIASLWERIFSFYFLDELNGYISGEGGALYKTTDGGYTWEWSGFQPTKIYDTSISAIYFLNGYLGFAIGLNGKIHKTIDGGKSWTPYSPTYNDIKQLDFITADVGYALIGNQIFKSTNGGDKWLNLGPPVNKEKTQQIDFIDKNTGFAIVGGTIGTSGNSGSVYKTSNGSDTWYKVSTGYVISSEDLTLIDFVNQDTGFVSSTNGLFRTKNGGRDWEKVENISGAQIQFISTKIGYIKSVGPTRIYKTFDGGITWKSIFENVGDISCFHFSDENHGYTITYSGSMFKTTDGGINWTELVIPYGYYTFVKFYSNQVGYILDYEGQLYKTEDGGTKWQTLIKIGGITAIELLTNDIYLSGSAGRILKSKVEVIITGLQNLNQCVSDFAIYPNPTFNSLKINTQENEFQVMLFDLNGNKLRVFKNEPIISLSCLPTGMYLLKIITEKEQVMKKVIKH